MMTIHLYKDIINTIKNHPSLRECQEVLEEKFPLVSAMTFGSILGSYVQRKMKATHSKHNNSEKVKAYYKRYLDSVAAKEAPGIILRLADEIQICPVLVARFILDAYLREQQEKEIEKYKASSSSPSEENEVSVSVKNSSYNSSSCVIIRQEVTKLLRDTALIEDRDLSYEVHLCTIDDDHYGPIPDAIKQSVGAEYEQILKEKLVRLGVCFVDENLLRKQGYDKTPDFKLEIPIAIAGQVVNWIESKALFGDEETHQTYLDDQLMSYWNRFGPGLVIYWLGFVDTLESITSPGILIRDDVPSEITFINFNQAGEQLLGAENHSRKPTLNRVLNFDGLASKNSTDV